MLSNAGLLLVIDCLRIQYKIQKSYRLFVQVRMSSNETSEISSEIFVPTTTPPKLVDFVQSLYKKCRVLKVLSNQQKNEFELEIINLLLNEQKQDEIDKEKYELLVTEMGVDGFVLQILADVLKLPPEQAKKEKISKDISDATQILEDKFQEMSRRQKIINAKQTKIKNTEANLVASIKSKADSIQKEIIDKLSRKEQELIKKVNASIRSLRVKEDLVKEKIAELKILEEKTKKLEEQDRKIKERLKFLEKRQEELKKRELECYRAESQESQSKSEIVQYKSKIEELTHKCTRLQSLVSGRNKAIASLEAQLSKKTTQLAHIKAVPPTAIKAPPIPQELNLSMIPDSINEVSLINLLEDRRQAQQEKSKENQKEKSHEDDQLIDIGSLEMVDVLLGFCDLDEVCQSRQVHEILLAHKVAIQGLNNLQLPNVQKFLLQLILRKQNGVCAQLSQIFKQIQNRGQGASQSLYFRLILAFANPTQNNLVEQLSSIDFEKDRYKLQMVEAGYLSLILQNFMVNKMCGQAAHNCIVEVMLKIIESGQFYEKILTSIIKNNLILGYLENIFQKYQANDELIENISLLFSRMVLYDRRSMQLSESFKKTIKIKMKVLKEGLTYLNLKSILDNLE